MRRTEKKKQNSPKVQSQGVGADSTSDSESSDGEVEKFGKLHPYHYHLLTPVLNLGSCSKLMKMLNVDKDHFKMFEFDSRVGLNGQQCLWKFPCILDEVSQKFFVWLGDVSIDKFTKSTFMNLVGFAEKAFA